MHFQYQTQNLQHMRYSRLLFIVLVIGLLGLESSCNSEEDQQITIVTPEISSKPVVELEGNDGTTTISITFSLSEVSNQEVSFQYHTEDITAFADYDYDPIEGTLTIPPGQTNVMLPLTIIADDIREGQEQFKVVVSDPVNGELAGLSTIITINNDDNKMPYGTEDYSTPNQYRDWDLVWGDEFSGMALDTTIYSYETGSGCNKNLCGWGNNELQQYSAEAKNVRLENGNLIIEALQEDATLYTSARIYTQNKVELQYGRIDIRAKLPIGQGIWPALWMLGSNIDDVGWPLCGEIDIMEIIGQEPAQLHGTGYFGDQPWPNNNVTATFSLPDGNFNDRYHVFSLIWEYNKLWYLVDDIIYHTITPDRLKGQPWPYNQPFYFLFNVAVGGTWPGSPDETTIFPQQMQVDYIRVFQKK